MPGARRATVAIAAMTVQAPVLSIFISSIRSDGLMLMPPESKQTPLPTIARWRPSASRSPSPPERSTIIRGGLSLPRPTAMNMPMPSSVARSGSITSIHRSCCLGDRPGLLGEDLRADVVRGPVGERPGQVRALGDDRCRARRPASAPRRPRRARRGSARRGPAAATRPRRGRSCAGRTSPRPRRGRPARRRPPRRRSSASASGDSQTARRRTARPPSRRSAVAATRTTISRSSVGRVADRHEQDPPGRQLAGRRERGRVALAVQLAERGERLELAAGPPVELAERAVERRIGERPGRRGRPRARPTADR